MPASRTISEHGLGAVGDGFGVVVAKRDEHRPRPLEHEQRAQPPVPHPPNGVRHPEGVSAMPQLLSVTTLAVVAADERPGRGGRPAGRPGPSRRRRRCRAGCRNAAAMPATKSAPQTADDEQQDASPVAPVHAATTARAASSGRRNWPVYDSSTAATSSGVPTATISPPASPPSGPEVDEVVGLLDHVEIVLDHEHRVAAVDEPLQHLEQLLDVGEVQPGRRLVEDVERLARSRPSTARRRASRAAPRRPESVVAGWPSVM